MNDQALLTTDSEKDLGVLITSDLKSSRHCAEAVKKPNQALGMIHRHIVSRDKDLIVRLYKGIVRPHLEYSIQAWNPHYQKDIILMERVQRRATRLIDECKDIFYYDRLKICKLTTLEFRRIRGDLIEAFKILNDKEGIPPDKMFTRNLDSRTRRHKFKLQKERPRLDLRKFFFSVRVVNEWNILHENVIAASSVNNFKNLLYIYLEEKYGVSMSYTRVTPRPYVR
ncbi:MAG: hypothetical protein ABW185_28460 [Sedimenticola sp.]